ncbi:MAG: cytochrome c [Nitrospirota bacterium]|jgi:mono/diheme cytochrome c family protein
MGRRTAALVALLVAGAATLAGAYWAETRPPAEVRGARLAQRLGCFGCHDPRGGPGTPNPGAPEGHVPGWGGGNAMMYVLGPDDFEAWVLDGVPRRLLDSPAHQAKRAARVLQMPAYRGRVSARQLSDLRRHFEAVAGLTAPDAGDALRGYDVAEEKGCFGCHGPAGLGGVDNPGSFAGYVPGWRGRGHEALVKDRAELREWIHDGVSQRAARHPVIGFFLRRQQLQMPAFGDHLTTDELNAIMAYIEWLNGTTPSR